MIIDPLYEFIHCGGLSRNDEEMARQLIDEVMKGVGGKTEEEEGAITKQRLLRKCLERIEALGK